MINMHVISTFLFSSTVFFSIPSILHGREREREREREDSLSMVGFISLCSAVFAPVAVISSSYILYKATNTYWQDKILQLYTTLK